MQQQRSERLEISAVVFTEEENLLHGMDVKTWIQNGLVDTIIPYTSARRLTSYEPAWVKPKDIAHFMSLVKDTKCRFAPNLMPRALTPDEYRRKAHMLYGSGVQYLFFWDGIRRIQKIPRLFHREGVGAWIQAGQPQIHPTAIRLHRLGQWNLNVETPG